MLQTDFCRGMGRSQEFVDVRNLVMGYLLTISEKTFVFVRTGSSEHEVDKHPLRFKCFPGRLLKSYFY